MIRIAAGASGFLTLIQSGDRPERYGRSRRLATMSSSPSLRAWRNTVLAVGAVQVLGQADAVPGLAQEPYQHLPTLVPKCLVPTIGER